MVVTGWIVVGYRTDLQDTRLCLDETRRAVYETQVQLKEVSIWITYLELTTGKFDSELTMDKLAEVVTVMDRWMEFIDTTKKEHPFDERENP